MSNLFFTSDLHLGHENIIGFCNRPFKSVYHMNTSLIRNWNQRVKPVDEVIFLGDFCFRNTAGGKTGEGGQTLAKEYLEQLNGHITFVRGNHDNNNSLNTKIESLVLNAGGFNIFCTHRPIDVVLDYPLCLVGHVHDLWKSKQLVEKGDSTWMINGGVDVWKYRPVSLAEVLAEFEKQRKGEMREHEPLP